jgi:tetratricopeptide (TPR) repeat protein
MARSKLERAIDLTKDEEYLSALTVFLDVFGTEDAPPLNNAKAASSLSYFGLCLALVSRKYKNAIDLCKRAIDLEFYHGEHYANLTRVYVAAGNRKKAIETAEAGLKVAPEDDDLLRARKELGIRARPAVPFLDRSNPINVSLGQARHAKKLAESTTKRKKS